MIGGMFWMRVFSAHAEVVPIGVDLEYSERGILRARGGSSEAEEGEEEV